jgi:hypothetical protein
VSRFHFHRWAVIFLLVSKLIIGEPTHAMSHMAMPATTMHQMAATASSQDNPPCANHAQAGTQSDSSHDSNTSDTDPPAKKSCCETGSCVCPCLHSPAATAAVSFAVQSTHDSRVAVLVEGATWQRISLLFRPPA